jgi:hypothetical protein
MARIEIVTEKLADFCELRQIAIAWLLAEKAKIQAQLDRLDVELVATITAEPEEGSRYGRRSIH